MRTKTQKFYPTHSNTKIDIQNYDPSSSVLQSQNGVIRGSINTHKGRGGGLFIYITSSLFFETSFVTL